VHYIGVRVKKTGDSAVLHKTTVDIRPLIFPALFRSKPNAPLLSLFGMIFA